MVYIPLIYFLILFVFLYYKNGFDCATYLCLLYVVTSFFAILNIELGYSKVGEEQVTFLPTFIYCLLLSLFILPVYNLKLNDVVFSSLASSRFIAFITYSYFLVFIIYLVAYHKDIVYRLFFGNFQELRMVVNNGDTADIITKYPSYIELLLSPIRFLASFSNIMVFIFFYSISFLKRKWWFNAMALLSSTTVIFVGIIQIDRSKTFFWIIIFGLVASIFFKKISSRLKKFVVMVSAVLMLGAVSYMARVTEDRFGYRDTGVEGGVIDYAGQPYLNFCYFWNCYESPEGFTTKYLFPGFHTYVLRDFDGLIKHQREMSTKSHMQCGVFYTHLGSFLVSAGYIGPFFITLVYLLLFLVIYRKSRVSISFETLFLLFFLLIIPAAGCISYFYVGGSTELVAYFWIVMMFIMKSKNKRYNISNSLRS